MFSVDYISSHRLLHWTQHVGCYYQLVNKIQVMWGDFWPSTYALFKRTETLLASTTSIDVFQDEPSGVIINRGAQNVVSMVVWWCLWRWCLWRVQRGPSGPVQYCVICSRSLHFGFIVFLQWNPAIKLLCNDVDVVLVYLVDSVVLVCCCDKYRIVLCTILPI